MDNKLNAKNPKKSGLWATYQLVTAGLNCEQYYKTEIQQILKVSHHMYIKNVFLLGSMKNY